MTAETEDDGPVDPVDAGDVQVLLAYAMEKLGDYLEHGEPGTIETRLRLHALLKDLGGNLGSINLARMSLAESIAADMGEHQKVVLDGRVWKRGRVKSSTKPDHQWLRSQIGRAITAAVGYDHVLHRPIMPTEEQRLARMWDFVEPALGRTGVFREAGIDLDEAYESVEWRDDLTDK